MDTFDINGVTYRLAKLDAMTQFHVMRRVAPIMASLGTDDDATKRLFEAVGHLSDEDAEYVINKALSDCRRQSGENWAKIYTAGRLMFDDITMPDMLRLTFETLKENMIGFFTGLNSNSRQEAA